MGSVGGEGVKRRKAMWLYPKVSGFNPPERWGHSACFADGVIYVFGGCCGGLHFSDVLTLNLETMTWISLATTGHKPGTRDSHSAVIVGQKMIVLGGTNGVKKVNDLHILDLLTKEWSKPTSKGNPPCPRESHTATLVGEDRLVIFGGSGEGEANYLNDVHVLDLKTITWSSPEVKGDPPAPRDSHAAVAIGNKLLIYGGDCGDRYHGEVDVLDTDTMSWSRQRILMFLYISHQNIHLYIQNTLLIVQGSSPGVRAGHAAVHIGRKVYIIGGVGDKQYYSDVWVLDVAACAWAQLEIRGQQPQGRFSHTVVVTNADIAIYGGCGEDERPLNELLILQLGSEHPNGRYNVSMCKIFGSHWSQEKKKFLRADNLQNVILKNGNSNRRPPEVDAEQKGSIFCSPDNLRAKRRRVNDSKVFDIEAEQEEHSLSISQHSSPSQSDQEQNTVQRLSSSNKGQKILPKTEQFLRAVIPPQHEMQLLASDQKLPPVRQAIPHLIGAEVYGTVDGSFDSGYLMTANVKGQIFRGVLFAPGPSVVAVPRQLPQSPASVPQQSTAPAPAQSIPKHVRPPQQTSFLLKEGGHHVRRPNPVQVMKAQPPARLKSDLQGVVLTLGGPGA
ncbi:rab9 effector protein with kelch motifs-like isoform X2 [Phalaenopsis equestris]|uniref:rab9 effector protein with kelch motifs-like isoform X2 n=1 Tax=Phalaenopsis equestris TaxID=78828 RepID=UPI0009E52461|nr:rab9 effector protein with kelch motifs-like isoform X2 [Phalaenopsis equestris]